MRYGTSDRFVCSNKTKKIIINLFVFFIKECSPDGMMAIFRSWSENKQNTCVNELRDQTQQIKDHLTSRLLEDQHATLQ